MKRFITFMLSLILLFTAAFSNAYIVKAENESGQNETNETINNNENKDGEKGEVLIPEGENKLSVSGEKETITENNNEGEENNQGNFLRIMSPSVNEPFPTDISFEGEWIDNVYYDQIVSRNSDYIDAVRSVTLSIYNGEDTWEVLYTLSFSKINGKICWNRYTQNPSIVSNYYLVSIEADGYELYSELHYIQGSIHDVPYNLLVYQDTNKDLIIDTYDWYVRPFSSSGTIKFFKSDTSYEGETDIGTTVATGQAGQGTLAATITNNDIYYDETRDVATVSSNVLLNKGLTPGSYNVVLEECTDGPNDYFPSATVHLVLKFDGHTITYYDGTTKLEEQWYEINKITSKPEDPTKKGYEFDKWLLGENEFVFGSTLSSDIDLKAHWIENEYTVSFDPNGALGSQAQQTRKYSQSLTLPTETTLSKNGFEFKGWLDSNNNTISIIPANTDSDVTVYADWSEETYQVVYNSNGGTGSVPAGSRKYSESYTLATEVSLKKAGYTFDGWDLNGNKVGAIPANTKGDVTVCARWIENEYKVSYNSGNTEATGEMADQTRKYTEAIDPLADCAFKYKGYRFVEWLDKNNSPIDKVAANTDEDVTVTASWAADELTVNIYDIINETRTLLKTYTVLKDYSLAETTGYVEPQKDGYLFVGYVDQIGNIYDSNTTFEDDADLFVNFAEVKNPSSEVEGDYSAPEDENAKKVADNIGGTSIQEDKVKKAAGELVTDDIVKKTIAPEVLEKIDLVDRPEDVDIVVETKIEMSVDKESVEVDNTDKIKRFIVDITPKYTIKAVNKNDTNKSEVIESSNMKLYETVTLIIYLPDSFTTNDKVWIKHNNIVFGGENGLDVKMGENNKPYVSYQHYGGFSPFEVSKEKLVPDVAPQPVTPSYVAPRTGVN